MADCSCEGTAIAFTPSPSGLSRFRVSILRGHAAILTVNVTYDED